MAEGVLPGTARALDRRLAVEQAECRVPSIVGALIRDGHIIWSGSRGRVNGDRPTMDTQYRIGSLTKTFVAVMIMRLRDEGALDPGDELDKHLPGTPVGDRTIAQLLSHSSGMTAESPGDWWERTPGVPSDDLVARLTQDDVKHRAARRLHYSNVGFGLLGAVVAQKRGKDWAQAVQEEILAPLGMGRTTPMPQAPHAAGHAVHPWADVLMDEPAHDHVAMGPAGQLWSTGTDIARWSAFLCGDTGEVLHPDTVAEMREPVAVADGPEWTVGWGLGLELTRHNGYRLAGHGGSMPGFLASVRACPDERTGVLFLANTTSGVTSGLALDLLDILGEQEPYIPEEWAPDDAADPALLELTGPWYWGPAPFAVRLARDGWLDLSPIGRIGRASRFRPDGTGVKDTWIGLDGYYAGETLKVIRDAGGRPNHLNLNTFIFTRTPYDPEAPIPGGVEAWLTGS